MSEREIQKILFWFGGLFALIAGGMIYLGHPGYATSVLAFSVLLIGVASVGPSTIKNLGAKWGADGGHIGFDRYQPTEEEKKLIGEFSQDNPSLEIEKEGQKFIEEAEGRPPEKRSAEDYLALATDKWRAKNYAEALTDVYAGLALEPKNVRIQAKLILRKASIYSSLGLKEEGKKFYKEAIQLDPQFSWPYNNLGTIYYNQGKEKEAEAEFNKAVEFDSENMEAHNNLGNIYADQGKQDEAEAEYNKAIELAPEYADANFNLGLLYEYQKKFELAKQQFEKVLKISPDYGKANLGFERVIKKLEE